MCNKDTSFSRWQADAITAMINHEQIECGLLIKNSAGSPKNVRSRLSQLKYRSFLWQVYSYILGRGSAATASISLSEEFSATPKIECVVHKKGKFSQFLNDTDVDHIKSCNLDFILRFGVDSCEEVCVIRSFSLIGHQFNLVLSRIFKYLGLQKA